MKSAGRLIPRWQRLRAPLFLAVLTIVMFAVIEAKQPYFFLHTDNVFEFLPYFVHNLRGLSAGVVPLFNFHQFLGTAFFSCTQSAALYPPVYLAVWSSQALFGHYYATIEIIALIHLVIAAAGMLRLLQAFGLKEASACFGAIAWTFCSYVIIAGDSWIFVVEFAAYLPWILLYSLRQMGSFRLHDFAMLALLRLAIMLLGNPPFFLYTVAFDILAFSLLYLVAPRNYQAGAVVAPFTGPLCRPAVFFSRQGLNYLSVALLSAPILLPVLYQTQISAERKTPFSYVDYAEYSYKFVYWLNGLFTPFSGMEPGYWCQQQLLSHIGLLPLLFIPAAFLVRGKNRRTAAVFLLLALVAFLWASDTFVTKLSYYLPMYNRQRWPFRVAFFASFFLVVVASFGFDQWWQRLTEKISRKEVLVAILIVVFCLHSGNFLALYAASPHRSFQQHHQDVPYHEPLQETLKSGRIVTVVQRGSPGGVDSGTYSNSIPLLGFNYASLFGLYHFAGFESLVSAKNLNAAMGLGYGADFYLESGVTFDPSPDELEYFRKWGVKWYLVDSKVPLAVAGVLKRVQGDEKRAVLYDAGARPFAFWRESGSDEGAKLTFAVNDLTVATSRDSGGELVVNVLHSPFFSATIDGAKTAITETPDQQMLVAVPPGRHLVKLSYRDPYFIAGLWIAAGFLALSAMLTVIAAVRKRQKVKY